MKDSHYRGGGVCEARGVPECSCRRYRKPLPNTGKVNLRAGRTHSTATVLPAVEPTVQVTTKNLTRQELLNILHVRTAALEQIRQLFAKSPAGECLDLPTPAVPPTHDERMATVFAPGQFMLSLTKINEAAGLALTMGPDASTLCALANEEMERNRRVPCPKCRGKGTVETSGVRMTVACPECHGKKTVKPAATPATSNP